MTGSYVLKLPKCVYAGEGSMAHLADALKACGTSKVALFCDASIWGLGLAAEAVRVVEEAGVALEVTTELIPEPAYADVQKNVDWFRGVGADLILAIGGGSAMDAAKLVSVLATDEYTVRDLLEDPTQARKFVPTVMVPTTAGTGAEATPNAIVAVPEDELKVGIVNEAMIADYVILDPAMIKNLPRSIAAATGIDALCHAIECYTSTKANPFSDTYALEAFDLIINNIERACDDPEAMDAKVAMQIASFYAGIAITASGTTAVHALSYPLGGKYHVAHGVSNAILLMPVMHFNEPCIRGRLAAAYDRAIAGGAATDEEKSAAVIARMDEIVKHLDIPGKLDELGIKDVPVEQLAEAGMKVTRLLVNNMREVTYDDAVAIYQQIL